MSAIDDLHRPLTVQRIGIECRLLVIRELESLDLEIVPEELAGKE